MDTEFYMKLALFGTKLEGMRNKAKSNTKRAEDASIPRLQDYWMGRYLAYAAALDYFSELFPPETLTAEKGEA